MPDNERENIYNFLIQKETDELLEIWRKNDHEEWRDSVFELIEEIIINRTGEKPSRETLSNLENEFTDEEIVDDQPVFYSPKEVIKLNGWLSKGAILIVIVSVINNLENIRTLYFYIKDLFWPTYNPLINLLVGFLVVIFTLANIGFSVIFYWLAIKALQQILNILMQMEFNSRKQ